MITQINSDEALSIIEKREPIGLFYTVESDEEGKEVFVGIDNSTKNAWVEQFTTLEECQLWLNRGS